MKILRAKRPVSESEPAINIRGHRFFHLCVCLFWPRLGAVYFCFFFLVTAPILCPLFFARFLFLFQWGKNNGGTRRKEKGRQKQRRKNRKINAGQIFPPLIIKFCREAAAGYFWPNRKRQKQKKSGPKIIAGKITAAIIFITAQNKKKQMAK